MGTLLVDLMTGWIKYWRIVVGTRDAKSCDKQDGPPPNASRAGTRQLVVLHSLAVGKPAQRGEGLCRKPCWLSGQSQNENLGGAVRRQQLLEQVWLAHME